MNAIHAVSKGAHAQSLDHGSTNDTCWVLAFDAHLVYSVPPGDPMSAVSTDLGRRLQAGIEPNIGT